MSEKNAEATDPFGLVGAIVDGRYRVERIAGQGGFGVVYQAHHLGFDSSIALKVLRLPSRWSEARKCARIASFQREGRMLFELSTLHPAIVRAFETGTLVGSDGSPAPYLALEWLEGVSLERELCHRRTEGLRAFTLTEALTLLAEPAAGLSRAHARGVAHRDIKPANLFVVQRGGEQHVKILDFGIAKLVDESLDTREHFAAGLAATGSFTPLYAAPEQWLRTFGPTGTWTDVHALALVCVELLTGKAALAERAGTDVKATCTDAGRRPTPAALGLTLPPAVEDVFVRALALEPRERFRDVNEFWEALSSAAAWSPGAQLPLVPLNTLSPNGLVPQAKSAKAVLAGASTTAGTASRTWIPAKARVLATPLRARVATLVTVGLAAAAISSFVERSNHAAPARLNAATAARATDPPRVATRKPATPDDVTSARSALVVNRAAPLAPTALAPTSARDTSPLGAHQAAKLRAPAGVTTTDSRPPSTFVASPVAPAPEAATDSLATAPHSQVNLDDPALVKRK